MAPAFLQEDLIEDCLREQGLMVQKKKKKKKKQPDNQELLLSVDTFLEPMGMKIEDTKEACSSAPVSCLQHFSHAPQICVVDSGPNCP